MNTRKQEATNFCLVLTAGLFSGFTVYFWQYIPWHATNWVDGIARFVSEVLFNALLSALAAGFVLGCLIFPLAYYILKRFNKIIAVVFFIVGVMIGYNLPLFIKRLI